MSFADFEASWNRGKPVNLYLFRYGTEPGSVLGYTDAEQVISRSGVSYQPVPISRGAITASGTLDKSSLEIRMKRDLPLLELFRVYPPGQTVTLIIFQGHADDEGENYLAAWSGRVISFSREENEGKLTCEPISTALRRPGLRRNYQFGCPHVLYGDECRASKAAATISIVPTSFAGYQITLPAGWPGQTMSLKYIGGMIEWLSPTGERNYRTIMQRVTSRTYILGGPIVDLASGAAVDVILGCNHQAGVGPQPGGDCHTLHNNIKNFGGQMFIPFQNPIGLRNMFY